MPTGYTADLKEGKQVTFQEFAMKCARAFGALVEMRDQPFDATIPDEFRPSSYHLDAIETAKKRLAEVEKWSSARAERQAKKAFDDEVRSSKKYGEKNEKTKRAYNAMLKQVRKWVPPSKDHEGLKSFMIEQLTKSIEFDCLHTPTMPQSDSRASNTVPNSSRACVETSRTTQRSTRQKYNVLAREASGYTHFGAA